MISKYGNVIANARKGKSIFYSYLNIRQMQKAKAEYEYVSYMRKLIKNLRKAPKTFLLGSENLWKEQCEILPIIGQDELHEKTQTACTPSTWRVPYNSLHF